MKPHRFVVFSDRLRGFDTLEAAVQFAAANVPAVVCERRTAEDGTTHLAEILRHDHMFDEATGDWRIMLA